MCTIAEDGLHSRSVGSTLKRMTHHSAAKTMHKRAKSYTAYYVETVLNSGPKKGARSLRVGQYVVGNNYVFSYTVMIDGEITETN